MSLTTLTLLTCLAAAPPALSPTSSDQPTLVVYEIYDLLESDGYRHGGLGEPASGEQLEARSRELERIVRRHIDPPLAGTAFELGLTGTSLVTSLGAAQHHWVEAFLARQREARDSLFDTHCRILSFQPGRSARFGVGTEPRALTTREVEALVNAARTDALVELVTSPRVLAFRMQRATVSVLSQVDFVESWQVYDRVEPGATSMVVPIVKQVVDGVTLDCTVVPLADAMLAVDFAAELSELQRPIATESTPYGPIAKPEVVSRKLEAEVRVESGGTLLFPVLVSGHKELAILLSVREVRAENVPELDQDAAGVSTGERIGEHER